MRKYILFISILLLNSCILSAYKLSKTNSKVLLISLDGFRHDYFDLAEKAGINLKFFKKIAKIGFKADYLSSSFPTKTFPNHLSIITGCFVETHGIIDNKFYDPEFNENFSLFNVTQSFESKWFSNAEPIWVTNIKNGLKSGVIYWPGSLAPYNNTISPSYSFGIFNMEVSLRHKLDLVLGWLSNHDTTLGIVYHPQPDSVGHSFGPNSQQILTSISELDDSIGHLLTRIDALGLTPQLNVIIVSDHGMANVNPNCHIAMDNYIDPSLYYQGRQEAYSFWGLWPRPNANFNNIIARLRTIPNVTVFRKHEIPPQWNFRNNRRVAPIVVLAEPGCAMVHKTDDPVRSKGTHGYRTSFKQMMGIFMTWGPNIVSSNRSGVSVQVVDVFPLITEILGLQNISHSINGSLANIRWILKEDTNDTGFLTSLIVKFVRLLEAGNPCILFGSLLSSIC